MYKEICDYAVLYNQDTAENRRTVKIAAYVVLDSIGQYEMLEFIDKDARKEKKVPTFGTWGRAAGRADAIVEKWENVFCRSKEDGTLNTKHMSYIEVMKSAENVCDEMKAICCFLNRYEIDTDLENKIMSDINDSGLKPKENISFKIAGRCIEDLSTYWNEWLYDCLKKFNSKRALPNSIVSAISGKIAPSVPIRGGPAILNVPNDIKAAFGLARPVYVAAAKYRSYSCYGYDGALGFQISEEDAKLFVTGMEN